MGYSINCCKRDENTDNITEQKEEINNQTNEDYLILNDDNSSFSNNDQDCIIDVELPLDFPYTSKLINSKIFLTTNIFDDDQQEFLINDVSCLEEQSIYDLKNLQNDQLTRIKQLLEYCNKNGKPRPYDDFNQNGWEKFYPKNDPYFTINNIGINHNKIKIYNENNINNIKIYEGDLDKFGYRHGIGKYTTSYYVLIGMWKDDKFSGWGRESRCNGDVFEGRYENGLINGKGIFLNSKKCKYIGDFKNMRRWGKGKLATNKIIFEGDFYNNQIHGKGRIKFLKSGLEYLGSFRNNQINGYGIFKWKNGNKYEGEVNNGKMHGLGKYTYNNGKIFQGLFFNGRKINNQIDINIFKNEEKLSDIEDENEQKSNTYYNENNNSNLKLFKENNELDENTEKHLLSTYRNYVLYDDNDSNKCD